MLAPDGMRLNGIPTNWSLVKHAHAAANDARANALQRLFERYSGAAWRYLLAVTRSEPLAEDLFQEFALRLVRGDFRRADRHTGRFRDYVKAVLLHLVNDHYRAPRPAALPRPEDVSAPNPSSACAAEDDGQSAFTTSWRDELLHKAWTMLESDHVGLYAALRLHVQNPEATAAEKAEQFERQQGVPCDANRFRVMLHRSRQKFSGFLRQEVAATLDNPTDDELRTELQHLRLWRYCRIEA